MAITGRRLQLSLAITGAVAWILQGYDQALMNGLLTLQSFEDTFPSINTSTTALDDKNSLLQGTTVALYEVGAAFGALSCFFIGERFGRKNTTLGAAAVVLVGVILQATSFDLAQLIVARILTGLGVGSFTATIPTWVGESSDAHHRGWLIMLEGSFAIGGVAFVGWLELGFYFVPGSNSVSWRFPVAFQAIFPLAVLCIVPFLAESPRWLMSKDRHADARSVLARLLGEHEASEIVTAQLAVIQHSIQLEQKASHNPFSRSNHHLTRTLLAIGANSCAQCSGINVITFYSNTIFEDYLGYSGTLSRIITSCLQTYQFLTASSAIFLIDRVGRRKLLLLGAAGMVIATAGLAGTQAHASTSNGAAGAELLFYFIALTAFPIGLFLIPFMFAAEVAPLSIRSRVTAMASASNWIFNFMVAEVSPTAFDSIGWKYYLVYVCTNVVAFVTFYLFIPETKGRTLEDIDAIFLEADSALAVVKAARTLPPRFAEEHDLSQKVQVEHRE